VLHRSRWAGATGVGGFRGRRFCHMDVGRGPMGMVGTDMPIGLGGGPMGMVGTDKPSRLIAVARWLGP
jgi:hypothetical protein